MDLNEALKELYVERDRLIAAISQLESLAGSANGTIDKARSRRGRKSMGAAERREVSERMKSTGRSGARPEAQREPCLLRASLSTRRLIASAGMSRRQAA